MHPKIIYSSSKSSVDDRMKEMLFEYLDISWVGLDRCGLIELNNHFIKVTIFFNFQRRFASGLDLKLKEKS